MLSFEICVLTLNFSSFSFKVVLLTTFQQRTELAMPMPRMHGPRHCSKTVYIVTHFIHTTILLYRCNRHRNYAWLTEPPTHPRDREIMWDKSYMLAVGLFYDGGMEKRNSYLFRLQKASCFPLSFFILMRKMVFKMCGWKERKINNLTLIIQSI